ncbi:flavodoxin family protein [Nocardioides sp. GXQ0305]|uniref:flavodoxin family protein n=1 Tax=Nocardioides sp. GXQ0305 TaxID=3423912 RepID=UPI003D7EA1EB
MTTTAPHTRALVVYESMFGNTGAVAESVGSGLRTGGVDVELVEVGDAPAARDVACDLLVLGAPTHAFSLSRPGTRADAVRQGADESHAGPGLREWLGAAAHPTGDRPVVAVFDSRATKARRLPAAGRAAAKLARRHGFKVLGPPEAFLVEDVRGPLAEGELGRAQAWGTRLAARVAAEQSARDLG